MQVSDFVVGRTYALTTKPWSAPDGSGTVPGKALTVIVLPQQGVGEALVCDGARVTLAEPAEVSARKEFLRVKVLGGAVRLLHPETIATSAQVG